MKHLMKKLIPSYADAVPSMHVPVIVGLDSIGGSAASDTVKKIQTEGFVGKGYHEKPHILKYFCENAGRIIGDIPMVVVCVNQEKVQAAATPYGPPQKKVTGGVSQVFKDGHMIAANFKTLASGDGKLITLRTTKTSFCDSRKIEVAFRWNKFGASDLDSYGHHFDWALASANCLADPEKGVGEIRDIADVKVSDKGLVTCPQLGCKSVTADEFEDALMSDEYADVRKALYTYQKIDVLKDMDAYMEYLKARKKAAKGKPEVEDDTPVVKTKKRAAKQAPKEEPQPIPQEQPEEEFSDDDPGLLL
jgi:hypothetical protein